MADKSFGVKELNLLNASGTPTVTSPNNLNLNANTVAISTSATVGNNLTVSGQINVGSNIKIGNAGVVTATSFVGSGANLTGISAGISTDPSNVQATWKLGGGSGSGFTFTGPGQDGAEGNPNIYLVRGQRYLFDNTTLAGNHPFEFRNEANNADYTDGVSGAQNGLQYINVQHDAPAALKYRCTIHTSSMLGNIYIVGQHLANGADERVLTATSAYGMTAHSTLVYDGTDLRNTAGDIVSASGSASSPSHRSSDGNTGMFFPSADKLAFSTGGFSRVVIDDNDGMIIGTGQARATTDSGNGGKLTVGGGSNTGITIRSGTSSVGSLYFSDGTSGDDELRGLVQYNHTDNYLRFFSNASERLRIQSNGRVAIGVNLTAAAQSLLNLKGDSDDGNQTVLLRLGNDSSGSGTGAAIVMGAGAGASSQGATIAGFYDGTGTAFTVGTNASFNGSTTERLRINAAGHVMIGTTTEGTGSGDDLTISNTGNMGLTLRSTSSNYCNIYFSDATSGTAEYEGYMSYNHATNSLEFATSHLERLRIDSNGKLLVGRTSSMTFSGDPVDHQFEQITNNGYTMGIHADQAEQRGLAIYFTPSKSANPFIGARVGTSWKFILRGDGDCENANSSYGGISDVSLKENIVDANSQWNDIKNIKIRNFNFKASTGYDTHKQIGVVAQELETVCPNLVDVSTEHGMKTVASSVLYMKGMKALQEAMAKIEILEAEVAALKSS